METVKTRDTYWDVIKGVLIVLVVIGHIMQLNETDQLAETTVNLIYSFHMPLFVMVSGYFSNPDSRSFKNGILRLFETYIVLQLLKSSIEGTLNAHELLTPRFALWYLLSLVYWKIMLIFMNGNIQAHKNLFFGGMLILCFMFGALPLTVELSFQRTFAFMPFFVFGYLLRGVDYNTIIQKIPMPLAIVVFITFVLISYFVNRSLILDFSGMLSFHSGIKSFLISRLLILSIGSIMSMCVMRLTFNLRDCKFLCLLGQATLHIYIYHIFFFQFLKYLKVNSLISTEYVALLLYSLAIVVGLYFSSKIKIFNLILNPFTNLYNIWKTRS